MKSLKIGDYVRIRKDLTSGECGIKESALSKYRGEIARITKVVGKSFFINIDNGSYIWDNAWFEDENINIKKPHYEVGDYVRIKSNLKQMQDDDVDNYVGLKDDMITYAGQLARITKVENMADCIAYFLDIDNGKWYWEDTFFEYRLGNYEDNKIENRRFKYEIGYHRYEDRLEIFEGFIENFYPSGKSAFIDESGKLLVVPYERIEFIIPKENDND